MEIKTLKKALPYLLKTNVTPLIWGKHGLGKSKGVQQFCEENEYMFVDMRLGNMEVGDLLGLPDFTQDAKGNKIATKFVTPDWILSVLEYCKNNPSSKAIIFFDEFNRMRPDMRQSVFQMVLDGKHHNLTFPKNCHFMAAANYNDDGYLVTDISDPALMDRFCQIKLLPSKAEWFEYATKSKFSTKLVSFLKASPDLLDHSDPNFDMGDVLPSRRSWEFIDRLLKIETPVDLLQEICYGIVGKPATIALMESLKNAEKPITAKEVLKNFKKYEEVLKEYANPLTGGRPDLLDVTNRDLDTTLGAANKLKDSEAENVINYIKTIPIDQAFSLSRKLFLHESTMEHLDKSDLADYFTIKIGNGELDKSKIKDEVPGTTVPNP